MKFVNSSHIIFVYILLSLTNSSDPNHDSVPDEVTARTYLTAALQQYLGLTGTAIPLDILKVQDGYVWIRLPTNDSPAVQGACSQWSGKDGKASWRVHGVGCSIAALSAKKSHDLFNS